VELWVETSVELWVETAGCLLYMEGDGRTVGPGKAGELASNATVLFLVGKISLQGSTD